MNNLIVTGETRAFENDYNYRCDTFIKDCVSYYEGIFLFNYIIIIDYTKNKTIKKNTPFF